DLHRLAARRNAQERVLLRAAEPQAGDDPVVFGDLHPDLDREVREGLAVETDEVRIVFGALPWGSRIVAQLVVPGVGGDEIADPGQLSLIEDLLDKAAADGFTGFVLHRSAPLSKVVSFPCSPFVPPGGIPSVLT